MNEIDKKLQELHRLAYELLETCQTEEEVGKVNQWAERFQNDTENSMFALAEWEELQRGDEDVPEYEPPREQLSLF